MHEINQTEVNRVSGGFSLDSLAGINPIHLQLPLVGLNQLTIPRAIGDPVGIAPQIGGSVQEPDDS